MRTWVEGGAHTDSRLGVSLMSARIMHKMSTHKPGDFWNSCCHPADPVLGPRIFPWIFKHHHEAVLTTTTRSTQPQTGWQEIYFLKVIQNSQAASCFSSHLIDLPIHLLHFTQFNFCLPFNTLGRLYCIGKVL